MNNILIKSSVYFWLKGQTGWAEIGPRWPSHSEHIPKPTAGKYHHQLARPKPRTALLSCSLFYALIFFILFTWPLFLFLLAFIFFSWCAIIWELLVKHDLICHPVNISSNKVYNNHNNNMPGVSFAGCTTFEISSPNLEKLAFEKFRPGLAFRTTNWCDCAYTEVVSINYLWHFKTGVMPLQSVALKFSNVAIMH